MRSTREAATHFLVVYGSGAKWLEPIGRMPLFHVLSWVVIVLGTVGWALFLWAVS